VIDSASWFFLLLQVFFVDLLLGADNAIVIALACRRLPLQDARRAVAFGAAGAIVLRLAMVLFANALLGVPLVKLVGAWTLVVIALNVRAHRQGAVDMVESSGSASDFLSAAAVIMVADAAMSLDNVVALAAIAQGNYWLLAIGVLMSIPIIAYGAVILSQIIGRAPEILTVGAAFLGWIAGGMAVSDPLVAGWVQANAPGLGAFAPALVALFVLAAGTGPEPKSEPRSARAGAPAPQRAAVRSPSPPPAPVPAPAHAPPAPGPPAPAPPMLEDEPAPAFVMDSPAATEAGGWSEERVVVAGFVLLAFLAGLIIFIASFFDSLT
jgi:YjbE family integral membrane protein